MLKSDLMNELPGIGAAVTKKTYKAQRYYCPQEKNDFSRNCPGDTFF
jgi:hypothetical protein